MTGTSSTGPLHGVTLLDLTQGEAGRFCATLLADLGAYVTRIDDAADPGEASDSFVNRALLRNRHVARGGDPEVLLSAQLALHQAVLTDTVAPLLDFTAWPELIHCSITPFGLDSPWAQHSASDLVIQALSGFMELTGMPGRPPIRMGL